MIATDLISTREGLGLTVPVLAALVGLGEADIEDMEEGIIDTPVYLDNVLLMLSVARDKGVLGSIIRAVAPENQGSMTVLYNQLRTVIDFNNSQLKRILNLKGELSLERWQKGVQTPPPPILRALSVLAIAAKSSQQERDALATMAIQVKKLSSDAILKLIQDRPSKEYADVLGVSEQTLYMMHRGITPSQASRFLIKHLHDVFMTQGSTAYFAECLRLSRLPMKAPKRRLS